MGAEALMSYCEDCGLASCYERGGYCDTARRKISARLAEIAVRLAERCWFFRNGVKHILIGDYLADPALYPQLGSDGWIEVVW